MGEVHAELIRIVTEILSAHMGVNLDIVCDGTQKGSQYSFLFVRLLGPVLGLSPKLPKYPSKGPGIFDLIPLKSFKEFDIAIVRHWLKAVGL